MRALERLVSHGWVEQLDKIVIEAGECILTYFKQKDGQYRQKSDASPVTDADLAAHQILVRELTRLSADIPVISEESFDSANADTRALVENKATHWLVDPLDGTREFIAGRDEFTVNVALLEGGHPVAGWLYLPTKHLLYKAMAGQGAFKVDAKGRSTAIGARRCSLNSPVVLVSRSHQFGETELIRERYPQATVESIGSSYKYALVAEGTADLVARRTPTRFWDTAAADIIVREAGGHLVGWDGRPLEYTRADMTNPPFLAIGDPKLDWRRLFGFLLGVE